MFNRSIEMKFVKPKPAQDDDTPNNLHTLDYVQLARETGKDVVVGIVIVVGTYVALDTLRKIAVNASPKR